MKTRFKVVADVEKHGPNVGEIVSGKEIVAQFAFEQDAMEYAYRWRSVSLLPGVPIRALSVKFHSKVLAHWIRTNTLGFPPFKKVER